MSKELEKHEGTGKSTLSRLAGTVHPSDSASQLSSNLLFEEGQEAGGDAVQRIADTKTKQEVDKQSGMPTNSKALVPQDRSSRLASSLSRASSGRPGNNLEIEDIISAVSSSARSKSTASTRSKAMIPTNKALEAVAGSSLSHASRSSSRSSSSRSVAAKSTSGSPSSVSKASSAKDSTISKASSTKSSGFHTHITDKQMTIEDLSSQVSKASSSRSARPSTSATKNSKSAVSFSGCNTGANTSVSPSSRSSTPSSNVSKASSGRNNSKSTVSSSSRGSGRASGRSRVLVPAGQTAIRASPLRNELRAEDLNDDMYSISIHERGALQDMPSRDEMLQIILKENPHLEIDEATVIAENRIASSSTIGRSQIGGSIAPVSVISRADKGAISKASTVKGKSVLRSSDASALSGASSSQSKAIPAVNPSSVLSAASARPAPSSSLPKALSYYGKEIVTGTLHTPSELSAASSSHNIPMAAPLPRSVAAPASAFFSDPLAIVKLGGGSVLSTFELPDNNSNEIAASDLLALAQLREQGDARRAQALKHVMAQHTLAGSDLARKRMLELEIAKQSLADLQLQSQMQEFNIQNAKLSDLQRHAHEDKLAALERAQLAESQRKADSMMDAMRDRSQLEKARNREKRGDIAKAERDREDERKVLVTKEYERMDHDRTMETIDSFGRLMEASRPRDTPQPRRTNLNLEHAHRYKNPQTGGDGVVNMRIHKGCNGEGEGVCPSCGLEYIEHPIRQQRDGSITTRTGKRIMPSGKSNRPGGSAVSKASSSRRN